MTKAAIAGALAMLACGGKSKPAEPEPAQLTCFPSMQLVRGMSQSHGQSNAPEYDAAYELAEADVTRANELVQKQDLLGASVHFLACAKRFAAVPPTSVLHDSALAGADACIQNVAACYGGLGKLATDGKAVLDALATQEPRFGISVNGALADPQCGDGIAVEGTAVALGCAAFAMGVLHSTLRSSHEVLSERFTAAETTAKREFELATQALERSDYAAGAAHHLACAEAYAAVPADDSRRGYALGNLQVCLGNAMYNYANAGTFAEAGRARIAELGARDADLKKLVDALLAKAPTDCKVSV